MRKEQVIELRKLHEGYNMSVFRTEGVFHKENNEKSHLIWDDDLEICHSINVNTEMHLYRNSKVRVDSFDYEAITGIYSDRSSEDLKIFLDKIKIKGLINDEEYKDILKDYNF